MKIIINGLLVRGEFEISESIIADYEDILSMRQMIANQMRGASSFYISQQEQKLKMLASRHTSLVEECLQKWGYDPRKVPPDDYNIIRWIMNKHTYRREVDE